MKSILKTKGYLYSIILFLGMITSFSLPPYNFFFINFLTLPILLHILINYVDQMLSFFLTGSNLYWITNSLTFDENLKFIIPFALILIPTFLGLFYGLITYFCSFLDLKNKFSSILIFSLFFGVVEFLRSFIFGGFPWNLIVFSLSDNLYSLQILSYIGTYSLNLLSITIFLLPIITFFQYENFQKSLILILGVVLILINIGYGNYNFKKFKQIENENLNSIIRVMSPKIAIERFLTIQDPEPNIIELIELSVPNNSEKTIFIFPEGVIPNINLDELELFKKLFIEKYNINHKIILGMNSLVEDKIFNSMILINNKAEIISKYNKNKLVPFGEFLPFENFFRKIGLKKVTQGYQSFSADNERKILSINQLKFLPLICYEIIYSGKINPYQDDYDFILNISEDGWFGKSIGPEQHLSHSIFRSIEEGKNILRSTNNGVSAHINPKGQIISQIKEKGFFDVSSIKRVKKTFFAENGNKIFFYFVLFYITLIMFLKIRENK